MELKRLQKLQNEESRFYLMIGSKIRERREKLHVSRADFAYDFGVTVAAVSAYELGLTRIGIYRLVKMAEYLEIPLVQLLVAL